MKSSKKASRAPLRALDAAKLMPGDVILTADNSAVSRVIRRSTRADTSHAMIYVESHSVIEADVRGVHARNTQRLHYPGDRALYVLRPDPPLTPAEAATICFFARNKVGSQYTVLEAAQSVSPLRGKAGRRQFCSRLIGQAYAAADRHIGGDPDYLSPGDLLRSSAFKQLDDATREVDAAEAEHWANLTDMTGLMVEATNAVLDSVRKLDPDIQTFEDVAAFLVREPQYDALVLAYYEAAGYLEVWRDFAAAALWQYDGKLMAAAGQTHRSNIEAYCLDTLANREGAVRFETNLAGYTYLYAHHGLRTFARLRDLYRDVVRLDAQRREVALAWLRSNAPHHLTGGRPHTDSWFTALELRNHEQAALTRAVLNAAGRIDVCSICGDDPAVDMRLAEASVADGARLTLKLCDDCREIRARSLGEIFEELSAPASTLSASNAQPPAGRLAWSAQALGLSCAEGLDSAPGATASDQMEMASATGLARETGGLSAGGGRTRHSTGCKPKKTRV